MLLWNIDNLNSAKKSKNIFFDKNSEKNQFTIDIAYVRQIFGFRFNFRVHNNNSSSVITNNDQP